MKYTMAHIMIICLFLIGSSYIYHCIPIIYTVADTQFAHEYALETLDLMATIAQQGDTLYHESTVNACDYYYDQKIHFDTLKQAALFLKPDLTLDFVYAFALAEDWCNYAAKASYYPNDLTSANLARIKYQRAYQEFQAISRKKYHLTTNALSFTRPIDIALHVLYHPLPVQSKNCICNAI